MVVLWMVWLALSLTLSAAGYAAYAAAHPRAQRWGVSRWRLDGPPEAVALTFDDGPSNETPRFLDALEELGVSATFFVCGANVERRPAIARAIVAAGHGIANHTFTHPCLPLCSQARVRQEICKTQDAIGSVTGHSSRLFRPPFGLRSPYLKTVLPAAGLTSVHWTVIGKDWKWNADRVTQHVMSRTSARGIVCLHDGHGTRANTDRSHSLAALRQIVPRLQERGHRFVRIPAPGMGDGG